MKKILVFGSQGMFGHIAVSFLRSTGKYEVIPCARRSAEPEGISVDVTDFAAVKKILADVRPDLVLNCIGMLVKASADHPDMAILINSYFPHFLAQQGKMLGFKLIHISTDCVFSGKTGSYRDSDFRDGDTPYARTKAMGEIIDERNLTIRTSIIGPEIKADGTGLFLWFMRQHGPVTGYSRAFWSGVTTLELAKFTDYAISHDLTGLFQLSMPEKIAKSDLLNLFKKIWGKNDVEVIPSDSVFCDKSMIGSSRPDVDYMLPVDYETMLRELWDYMIQHPERSR